MKLDHIGIAVKSIEESCKVYECILNTKLDHIVDFPSQNIKTLLVETGNAEIELIQPLENSDKGVSKFIDKKGEGLHHIAFEVDNFDETLENLKSNDIKIIGNPTVGVKGNRIVFIHPKCSNGTLIELCEKAK